MNQNLLWEFFRIQGELWNSIILHQSLFYFDDIWFILLVCRFLWWHFSSITCQIIMSTCQIFILTWQLFILTWKTIKSTCQIKIVTSSFISCFYSVSMPLIVLFLSIWYLTSRHNDLTGRLNYLKSSFQTIMLTCQIMM